MPIKKQIDAVVLSEGPTSMFYGVIPFTQKADRWLVKHAESRPWHRGALRVECREVAWIADAMRKEKMIVWAGPDVQMFMLSLLNVPAVQRFVQGELF